MPLCVLYTNISTDKVPENFEVRLSEVLADVLSKPIERITVNVLAGQRMSHAGTSEPACWLNLWSIGVFDEERNSQYATPLNLYIHDSLKIDSDRIRLLFHDIEAFQVAKPLQK